MSGHFQYNLTTESQFQQMKQRNLQLAEENMNLRKTLEEMIKVNNQLSDTIEQFNNTALANPNFLDNIKANQARQNKNILKNGYSINNQDYKQTIRHLQEQVESLKNMTNEKISEYDNNEIVSMFEGMVDSFTQMQKCYESQINAICEQFDHVKNEWEGKIFKIQETYFEKTRILEQIIKQVKKKQEIVNTIQKKAIEDVKNRKINVGKNKQLDTASQRKAHNKSYHKIDNSLFENQKPQLNKQIQELRNKQLILNQQLKEKNKTIFIYNQLLQKLKKKLAEKY